jgi:hypothetical protein
VSSDESPELRRENAELRRANEILKAAPGEIGVAAGKSNVSLCPLPVEFRRVDETESKVIDLDLPAQQPSQNSSLRLRLRRLASAKISAIAALGLIAVAAVVGEADGAASRMHQTQRPPLSVQVFPQWNPRLMGAKNGQVALSGQLTVVNAGTVAIKVRSVQMDQADARLRDNFRGHRIAPGVASTVDVDVKLACPGTPLPPLSPEGSLEVETTEASRFASSVTFDNGAWGMRMVDACLSAPLLPPPPSRPGTGSAG